MADQKVLRQWLSKTNQDFGSAIGDWQGSVLKLPSLVAPGEAGAAGFWRFWLGWGSVGVKALWDTVRKRAGVGWRRMTVADIVRNGTDS